LLKTRRARGLETALCAVLLLSLVISLSSFRPVSAETLGSWNSTTPWENSSTIGITGESCATYSGYIYCVGGFRVGGPLSGVYYAPVSSSGVGTWASTTGYPTGFDQGSCAISGGYIYCVGGETDSAGDYTNAVYYAQVSSSGVGAWTLTTAYPIIIERESCAVSSGYIYCVGGTSDESYPYTPGNGVFYAPISASGVGVWQTSTFPTVIDGESCTISSGYIYCVGGDTAPVLGNPYTDIVFYASVSALGLGTWTSTTHYPTDITYASCATYSGYIYCVGGFIDGSSFTNAVYYAQASSSGVGAWTSTTGYPNQTYLQSCPIYSGYIYCVGGQNALGYISGLVYYASISGTQTLRMTATSVSCSPVSISVNVETTCTATVTDTDVGTAVTPTGSVTFSSSGVGTFTAGSCSVSGTGAIATCQVGFTPSPGSEGQQTITADYLGDSNHMVSNGNFILTVDTRSISTTISCASPFHFHKPIACTVTVVDTSPGTPITPAGTVTFTSNHAGGFSSTTCQLSGSGTTASCSVTFTPTRIAVYTLKATYSGDSDHGGSTASKTFRVI